MVHRAYTRDMFDGAKPEKIEDFQAEFPDIEYEQFAHITSVVRRQNWSCVSFALLRMLCMMLSCVMHQCAIRHVRVPALMSSRST